MCRAAEGEEILTNWLVFSFHSLSEGDWPSKQERHRRAPAICFLDAMAFSGCSNRECSFSTGYTVVFRFEWWLLGVIFLFWLSLWLLCLYSIVLFFSFQLLFQNFVVFIVWFFHCFPIIMVVIIMIEIPSFSSFFSCILSCLQ